MLLIFDIHLRQPSFVVVMLRSERFRNLAPVSGKSTDVVHR